MREEIVGAQMNLVTGIDRPRQQLQSAPDGCSERGAGHA